MRDGFWPKDSVQRAFVEGAKWWQFHHARSTMFGSERDEAEAEAVKRYGELEVAGIPTLPREGKAQDDDRWAIETAKNEDGAIIGAAGNLGGSDDVEAGGAAGEDRRTVEAVSKGDDGVESGAVGVGEQKGVDG
jgi:hypothetical protein